MTKMYVLGGCTQTVPGVYRYINHVLGGSGLRYTVVLGGGGKAISCPGGGGGGKCSEWDTLLNRG